LPGLAQLGTDFKPDVNYARIAEAAGILGVRVEDPAGLPGCHKASDGASGASALGRSDQPYELIKPPDLKLSQAWGFSLFMLKETVLGNASNINELIGSNLR